MRAEKSQLCFARHACNLQLAALTGDAVHYGAEMQVYVAVRCFAQTASVGFTHQLTALFCRCRYIEQVPAQRSLKILIKGGAAGLWANKKEC